MGADSEAICFSRNDVGVWVVLRVRGPGVMVKILPRWGWRRERKQGEANDDVIDENSRERGGEFIQGMAWWGEWW